MDFSSLMFTDTIITVLILGTFGLSYLVWQSHKGYALLTFIVMLGVTYLVMNTMYRTDLDDSGQYYHYKQAIEKGIDNGFKKDFYSSADEKKQDILRHIESLDLERGRIAVNYGFGSSAEPEYFRLYFTSMIKLFLLPIVLPAILIAGGYYFGKSLVNANDILNFKRKEKAKELDSILKSITQKSNNLADLEKKIKELENGSLKKELDRYNQLKSENKILNEENVNHKAENERLKREKEELDTSIRQKNRNLENKADEMLKLDNEIKRLDKRKNFLEKDIAKKRQDLANVEAGPMSDDDFKKLLG